MLARHRLVETGVADFIERSGLDLPVSAQAITAWIGWCWTGTEAGTAPGVPEEQATGAKPSPPCCGAMKSRAGARRPQHAGGNDGQ